MSKQDRVAPRTAADLESKYNFGKSFAEAMGFAEAAEKAAGEAKDAAENASNAVGELDNKLDQTEIFNRLTDNGKAQGVYRGEDGQIYINASYIKSGEILADLIKTGTLNADLIKSGTLNANLIRSGVIASTNGLTTLDLNTGRIVCQQLAGRKVIVDNGTVSVTDSDGSEMISIADGFILFYDYNKNSAGSIFGYTGGLSIACQDADSGTMQSHRLKWKTINGVKTLTGE